MTDWQPIETAPTNYGFKAIVYPFSIHRPVGEAMIGMKPGLDRQYNPFRQNVWKSGQRIINPTHWIPLPDPPKDTDK